MTTTSSPERIYYDFYPNGGRNVVTGAFFPTPIKVRLASNKRPSDLTEKEKLERDRKEFIKGKIYSDVTFLCRGGVSLKSYKMELSLRSEVFANMFQADGFDEFKKNTVDVSDESPELMGHFLDYMEGKDVDEKKLRPFVMDLYRLADKYFVQGLMDVCEEIVFKDKDAENCAEVIRVGSAYNNRRMLEGAWRVFIAKKEEVMESEGWKSLLREDPKVVVEFMVEMI